MKQKLYRAGFLPYRLRGGSIEFLFMLPSDPTYGGDRFQMAKGKIEDNETPLVAALREASEELGLIEENVRDIRLVGEYLGRTTVYTGRVDDSDKFNTPHFETGDTRWMTLSEYEMVGRDLHTDIVRDALRVALTC